MQTPFQLFNRNMSYSTSTGAPDPVMYGTSGYNCWEGSLAPHPFRVNSEGNACAILAGRTTTDHLGGLRRPVPPRLGGLRG